LNPCRVTKMVCPCACAMALLLLLSGCAATGPAPSRQSGTTDPLAFPGSFHETPAPEANWRGHQFAACSRDESAPAKVESLLALCGEFFREGSGSDGMIELEMALEEGVRHPLLDLTLGQLYLLAGQGEPALLPAEGPAADVGDWQRNRVRLLGRSRDLLERAALGLPDDGAVDYLLADVERAAGNQEKAAVYQMRARDKCTAGRGMAILRQYQILNRYPAKYLGGASPEYPAEAVESRISGDVTLDLLLDPHGRIRQGVQVSSPAEALSVAAFNALRQANFEAARVGKYTVWCWLRVTIAFNLD
jgi:TonB family protein